MKFSERIIQIANFIEDGSSCFDVGADHGYLENYLSNYRNIHKILAVENKIGPFSSLKNNTCGLKNVECSFSSGLDNYNEQYDTVIMTGMGGKLIINLLNEHLDKLKFIKNLIIGPQKNIDEVRKDLLQLGFIINKEAIVKENNKYYFIIHLIHGIGVSYSDDELQFGYNVINKELQKEYIDYVNNIKSKYQK